MLEKFHYPWEMMPLLYVILKKSRGDVELATRDLFEGMNDCRNRMIQQRYDKRVINYFSHWHYYLEEAHWKYIFICGK